LIGNLQPGRYGDPANSLMIAAAAALLVVGTLGADEVRGTFLPAGRAGAWSAAAISLPAPRVGRPSIAVAQRVMKLSLLYLPAVLLVMVHDKL
jgi:hypothetical protein